MSKKSFDPDEFWEVPSLENVDRTLWKWWGSFVLICIVFVGVLVTEFTQEYEEDKNIRHRKEKQRKGAGKKGMPKKGRREEYYLTAA